MITGVVLLLFDDSGRMLLVRELGSKPQLGKYAGQVSPPMETVRDDEDLPTAICRLIAEEIGVGTDFKPVLFRSFDDIIPDVILVVFCGRCGSAFEAVPQDDDIEYAYWDRPEAILAMDASKKRLGVDIILRAYLASRGKI